MAEQQPLQDAREAGTSPPLCRLLVIDDDTSICEVIEKLAEKVGFGTARAVSVDEAARQLRESHFDCITLDLGLGEDSGVEVLKVLADMRYQAPVIIISGSQRTMRDFATMIGNNMHLPLQQHLAKPINLAALKKALVDIKANLESQCSAQPAA
jgi:two-component system, chemotaxis family, chemotaxis protein CheY